VFNALENLRNGGENIAEDVFKHRWTGPGSTNKDPAAYRTKVPSSYYLESGNYWRIDNITVGYDIPDIATDHISNIRLYISADNPFIITPYTGFTPEIIGGSDTDHHGEPYGTSGIEMGAYPTTRTFLFGINIDLK
jgi:hypothetical protein